MKGIKHRKPNETRNGKIRLGPLNISQLEELIKKSVTKREKARYMQRLDIVKSKYA